MRSTVTPIGVSNLSDPEKYYLNLQQKLRNHVRIVTDGDIVPLMPLYTGRSKSSLIIVGELRRNLHLNAHVKMFRHL